MPFPGTIGQGIISWAAPAWQIASLRVDNPTGSWLRIVGVERFVPPYTAGYVTPFTPSQLTVTVLYADSPSSSVSNPAIGKAPLLTIYDELLPPDEGVPTGAGLRETTAPIFKQAFVDAFSDTAGLSQVFTMITAPAARRLIITRIACTLHNPGFQTIGNVQVQWRTPAAAPYDFQWFQEISPEAPYASDVFADGSALIPAGQPFQTVWGSDTSRADGLAGGVPRQSGHAMIQYYEENA